MKRTAIIMLLLVFVLGLMAQTAKDEALQSLDNARKLITQDNYSKAQDEINFASSKISEILSEQLVKYLPDAPAGYKVEERNAQSLGQMGGMLGSANAIAAVGKYSSTAPAGNDDEYQDTANLTLTITIGGLLGKTAGFAALGQMFGGMGAGTGSKSIRVGGYTATQEFDASNESGKLTVQVGEKVSVLIEGNYIKTADIMKTLAEKIDLAKLEKAF